MPRKSFASLRLFHLGFTGALESRALDKNMGQDWVDEKTGGLALHRGSVEGLDPHLDGAVADSLSIGGPWLLPPKCIRFGKPPQRLDPRVADAGPQAVGARSLGPEASVLETGFCRPSDAPAVSFLAGPDMARAEADQSVDSRKRSGRTASRARALCMQPKFQVHPMGTKRASFPRKACKWAP